MSSDVLEQPVLGSRRISNYLVAAAVSIGGIGFLLASLSSYLGRDLLPIGHPAALIFVPQGVVMGLYSIAASPACHLSLVRDRCGCRLRQQPLRSKGRVGDHQSSWFPPADQR